MTTPNPNRVSATLTAASTALGGHYRTCVAGCDPIGQNCLVIVGHDTTANASASSRVRVKITFSNDILQQYYDFRVSSSQPDSLQVQIIQPAGPPLTISAGQTPSRLKVNPGDIFYVEATLSSAARNGGGCCKDEKLASAHVDVAIEKPPILSANQVLEPFIVGGKQTSAYPYVVAILIRNELHCTGTVLGPYTILTAAHCIHGYENKIDNGEMAYLAGSVVTSPQYGPKSIKAATYPKGADAIQFNPVTYAHDIGLLYTSERIPFDAPEVHLGKPSWAQIINKHALIFVGYGFNKSSSGDLVGAGVKREAPWNISNADDWRFYFQVAGKNTCSGDSGGPAFYFDENTQKLLLAGITSGGDKNCTWGADTRAIPTTIG